MNTTDVLITIELLFECFFVGWLCLYTTTCDNDQGFGKRLIPDEHPTLDLFQSDYLVHDTVT